LYKISNYFFVCEAYIFNIYRCTVHSDIHTVHSPTDAHLLKL